MTPIQSVMNGIGLGLLIVGIIWLIKAYRKPKKPRQDGSDKKLESSYANTYTVERRA